jgi:acyl-CoA thioester hydrolase
MDTRVDVYKPTKLKLKPYEHHVKYYETDQMRIVHHSNYIRWMEEARMDMMDQMGFGYDKMEELEVYSPVISVSCEYKSMVRFGETVEIRARVLSYNGVKLRVAYEMTDKETGELRAVAESNHCFLNMSGKPLSLKRSYPELDTKFFTLVDDEEE